MNLRRNKNFVGIDDEDSSDLSSTLGSFQGIPSSNHANTGFLFLFLFFFMNDGYSWEMFCCLFLLTLHPFSLFSFSETKKITRSKSVYLPKDKPSSQLFSPNSTNTSTNSFSFYNTFYFPIDYSVGFPFPGQHISATGGVALETPDGTEQSAPIPEPRS
jgi:hypothetical protein